MTLGVFTDDFHPHTGGMGRYVFELSRRLPQERLFIFSPCRNNVTRHVRVRPPLHSSLHNISLSLWLGRTIRRHVRDYNLTKLNVHCGPGGLFLVSRPDVPVLATSHHTYWQQARWVPSQLWKRIFIPFEVRTYRLAQRIAAVSEDTRRVIVDRYRIPSDKVVVIPNGVDRRQFHPLHHVKRLPDSILYVGRIDRRKGLDLLIESIPHALKRNPHVKLYVGGTGRDLQACRDLVRMRGLDRQVEFLGFIPESHLNEWYNRVECIVVPSRFEGFGLTVVEAMACGTSVIATNVDGLRTLVRNGVNGYLVDWGDPSALGERIATVLGDPATRQKLAEKGREMVGRCFDWDVIASRFSSEIENLA